MKEKNDMDGVSVIIPTLNEERYLPLLLSSLVGLHAPVDVIVVDGGSRDATRTVAKTFENRFTGASSLRVVSAARRISVQRNAGAALATYNTLIFMDADTALTGPDAYAAMLEEFAASGNAVAAPRLAPLEGGVRARCIAVFFISCVRLILFLRKKAYFAGSCIITRKDAFVALGGFDENKIVAEDIDYSERAHQYGGASVLHSMVLASARRFVKYGYGRMFWFYFKEGMVFLFRGDVRHDVVLSSYHFGEYDT